MEQTILVRVTCDVMWCGAHAGINSFFAGLAGSLPNTTFAQNNGVLALTRCASRSAGYSCGVWLFLFGVLAKVHPAVINQASFGLTPAHMHW